MQVISVNCPSCGGVYSGAFDGRLITCEYCGTRYMLSDDEFSALGGVMRATAAPEPDRYASSGVSMTDFARSACEGFLADEDVDASSFDSSDKVIRGLGIPRDDEVFLIHDDTMFHSGKNGFAITSSGLYCRDFGETSAKFVSWGDFARGEMPERDGSNICQDGVGICYFTDSSSVLKHQLVDLYEDLYNHARRVL